jgi:hypothetical protein
MQVYKLSDGREIPLGGGLMVGLTLDGVEYLDVAGEGAGATSLHAATHGAGGADPVTIDAATQITGSLPMLQVDPGITNQVIFANGGGALDGAALGAAHSVLKSNGAGTPPSFALIVNANVDPAAGIEVTKLSGLTESVQDTVGAMLVDGANIDFTYDDGAGTVTAALIGTIADARLSSNVPLKNAANTFTENQIVSKAQNAITSVTIANTTEGTASAAQFVLESDTNAAGSSRRLRFSLISEGHSTGLYAGKVVMTTDNVPRALFTVARGTTTGQDEDFGFTVGTSVHLLYLIRKETTGRKIAAFFTNNPTDTSGDGVVFIANATAAPSSNPSGGGVVYFDSGVLKVATPSATNNLNFTRQAALTAVDNTAIDATYGATEEAVLNNVRTRVNEIYARLQTIGLIT